MEPSQSPVESLPGCRIGLVATRALSNPTGIGEYTRRLWQALQSYLEDLWVVGPPPPGWSGHRRTISLPAYLRTGYQNKFLAPIVLRRYRFSLLHFMTESELYYLPPRQSKIVVTIHGCASRTLPPELHQQLPPHAVRKYRHLLRRADAIVTVSQASKRDIMDVFGVAPEKVTVVYNGVAEPFRRRAYEPGRPAQPRGQRRFILSVCAALPKKNLIGILQALAGLKSMGISLRLVHVGPKDWGYDAARREVQLLGLQPDVEFRGAAPLQELVEYYAAAEALVFPSFHEGFGLPILEAMACGCPVITSNCAAMPEIAGDAALFIDPHDSGQIADAILQLLTDKGTRERLIDSGRRRAQQYSWEKAAKQVIAVYRRVLNSIQ